MSRQVEDEVLTLVRDLGLSEEDAYAALGLEKDDPLLANAAESTESTPEDQIVEMFPQLPREHVLEVFRSNNGSVDKTSDELLNHEILESEKTQDASKPAGKASKAERKAVKNARKYVKRQEQMFAQEDVDVELVKNHFRISEMAARELYWSNDCDLAKTLLAKSLKPLMPATAISADKAAAMSTATTSVSRTRAEEVEDVGELAQLPHYELRQLIAETQKRVATLTELSRRPDRAQAHNRLRASEAAQDLRHWRHELQLMELAMSRPQWLRRDELPGQVLDLHGHTLEEAQVLAGDALRKFKTGRYSHLEIITGAGRHSVQGHAVIKPWLKQYLKSQGVRMREFDGSFVVSKKVVA